MTTPLFDSVRFARHLEAAFAIMWQRREMPPEGFVVARAGHRHALAPISHTPAKFEIGLHLERALDCHRMGKLAEATICYRQILETDPAHADALHLLGLIAGEMGYHPAARRHIARAIAIDGTIAGYHANLGATLMAENMASEAVAAFERALACDPDLPRLRYNLGNALRALGDLAAGEITFRAAIAAEPDFAEAYDSLGLVLRHLGRTSEAEAAHQRALEFDPGSAAAHFNLALARFDLGRLAEAETSCRFALAIDPHDPEALAQLVHFRQAACDWREAQGDKRDCCNRSARTDPHPSPFLLLSLASTPEDQFRCGGRWAQSIANGTARLPPPPHRRGGKIRLGYLSADFHAHATAYLTAELFERHDRSASRSSPIPSGEMTTARCGSGWSAPSTVSSTSAVVAYRSGTADLRRRHRHPDRSQGLHSDGRPQILAAGRRPMQVGYLGYPGTTGAEFIDYIIADPHRRRRWISSPFSAKRSSICPTAISPTTASGRLPNDPSRADCGLPDDGFVFCCFNNSFKITPPVFDIWMRLLQAVPGSVLWLLATNRRQGQSAPRSRGRGVDRRAAGVRPAPGAGRASGPPPAGRSVPRHPALQRPHHGQRRLVGRPAGADLPGATFAGRVAASLLTAVGLPELVTTSLADYQATALNLAKDAARLDTLHRRLAVNRSTTALFDSAGFTRHLEAAFAVMWQRRNEGLPPGPITVQGRSRHG